MKNTSKMMLIASAVMTAAGGLALMFSWSTRLLFPVGLSMGGGVIISHILGGKERDRVPVWLSVLFVFSFIPIILCIYWSVDAAVNGTGSGMVFPKKHGWEAFSETFLITTLLLTVIPAIPMAVIVQIRFIALCIKLRKKRISERS
jgi:hypothetical protein